ncbi:MAG: hypothetical protein U0166_04350 [Acidobacteriota bacterium]
MRLPPCQPARLSTAPKASMKGPMATNTTSQITGLVMLPEDRHHVVSPEADPGGEEREASQGLADDPGHARKEGDDEPHPEGAHRAPIVSSLAGEIDVRSLATTVAPYPSYRRLPGSAPRGVTTILDFLVHRYPKVPRAMWEWRFERGWSWTHAAL